MFDAIEQIAFLEGQSTEQLMLYLLNPNTDILKIRLQKKDVEAGSIFLMMQLIYLKMLKADSSNGSRCSSSEAYSSRKTRRSGFSIYKQLQIWSNRNW